MAYTHKEGQGSLFKNEKQSDRQPDYKGSININGTMYEVAGWMRTSQGGKEYISLQASLPRQGGQSYGGGQSGQSYGASQYGQSYGNRQGHLSQSQGYDSQQGYGSSDGTRQVQPYSIQPPMPSQGDMPDDLEDLPF